MNRESIYPLMLERYALGELPPDQMNMVKAALEQNSSLMEQLNEISRSNEFILKQYPESNTLRAIQLKAHTLKVKNSIQKQTWFHYLQNQSKLRYLIVASCLIVITPFFLYYNNPRIFIGGSERIKGQQQHLNIYRKTAGKPGAERLRNFNEVRKGDLLQVAYVSECRQFGAIVSLDGNGNVTLHFPVNLSCSSRLEPGGEKLLGRSYELDNAPSFEHFFFVTAKDSFDVSVVLDAVKKYSQQPQTASKETVLKIPEKFKQSEFILRKVSL